MLAEVGAQARVLNGLLTEMRPYNHSTWIYLLTEIRAHNRKELNDLLTAICVQNPSELRFLMTVWRLRSLLLAPGPPTTTRVPLRLARSPAWAT